MEAKERRALDKCFEGFLRDLDPTPSFLHSLYAEGILTEEQMDRISKTTSRETQVALLLRILPHRGPKAFTIFKEKLEKDYGWLAQKLDEEVRKLQSGQASINKRLITIIESQLIPLIYTDGSSQPMVDEKAHPGLIIQKLSDYLTNLELKCHKALDVSILGNYKAPLHQLIEEKLRRFKDEKKKVPVEVEVDDVQKEIKDLKRQLRDMMKLKAENDKLKNIVDKQKEKLKDYNKMTRDTKRYKQDMEKFKKDNDILRYEVETLREQLRGNIVNPFA
ncbi:uncharacterized protein LOC127871997 [Dreissena polymorpha]|uniref:CARD domain-containing protein n=1 Tax=Dreissena polymorpha TaxID=45954 RepID=A0A9D4LLE2_DREPO|nr:uncharacterized protein LOC127871997 [Dreissena polymorpha]KAH3859773.1 hypothetical protein DPMN_102596 [Dreissena polymorpha]